MPSLSINGSLEYAICIQVCVLCSCDLSDKSQAKIAIVQMIRSSNGSFVFSLFAVLRSVMGIKSSATIGVQLYTVLDV